MTRDLVPIYGPPDIRAIRRRAIVGVRQARHDGRLRDALRWTRVQKRASRTLRFAARLRAGRVQRWFWDYTRLLFRLACSHPLFSGALKNEREPVEPPCGDDRWTFPEDRWRC